MVKHIQQLAADTEWTIRQLPADVRALFSREVILPKLIAALEAD